jgi:hypothetical protein
MTRLSAERVYQAVLARLQLPPLATPMQNFQPQLRLTGIASI